MLMHVDITDLSQSANKLLLTILPLSSTCQICHIWQYASPQHPQNIVQDKWAV